MFSFLKRLISKFEVRSRCQPNSDSEIKFYALSPLVAIDCPIIASGEFKRGWVAMQAKNFDYMQAMGPEAKSNRIRSSHRCPGLVDIFSRGYIVCAHRDIFIHTRGDIENPEYATFPKTVSNERFIRGQVGAVGNLGQMGADPDPFMGPPLLGLKRPYPERTPNAIFKLEIPWLVKAPPDISLLYMGVPLSNNYNFTVVSGIQDTDLSGAITVLLWWHHHDRGDIYIKKGTPLVQILPVPKGVSNLGFSIITDRDKVQEQVDRRKNLQYMVNSQRVVDYDSSRHIARDFPMGGNQPNGEASKCPFKFLWQ